MYNVELCMTLKNFIIKLKQRRCVPFFIFLLLYPYIVGFSHPDSITTSFTEESFGIGTGQYGYKDCSGVHSAQYGDVGVKVSHKFEAPFRTGLLVGVFNSSEKTTPIIFPDLAFDSKYFEFGTTGIRIGNKNKLYVQASVLHDVPPVSGKGFINLGTGFYAGEEYRYWIGTNLFYYSKPGLAAQFEMPYSENTFIFFNGRIGSFEGVTEYGISIGMRLQQKN